MTRTQAAPNLRSAAEATALLAAARAEMLERAADMADADRVFDHALPLVCQVADADYAAVAHCPGGRWSVRRETGRRLPLPGELPADALDREQPRMAEGWLAAPLDPRSGRNEVLVAHMAAGESAGSLERLATLADTLGRASAVARARRRDRRRIERLEALLTIAGRFNQAEGMQPLLVDIAEAATRLIAADRASIFLWDRSNHTLVARPALGVDRQELRIPDDAGVVGAVLKSGQPQRVDLADNPDQINRQVDQQLGYHTRTLLCVPLRGRRGELLGVFEMINKLEGNFTDDDLETLVELAAHAAVALENTRERETLLDSRRQISDEAAQRVRLVGQCPAIEALRSTIRRVAPTDLAVLILGEHGTGKEVVSQSIHYLGHRRDQPFISVNCAAIPDTLLESELFGHEQGAFTDARETRRGKFELASGGTLFLDEIGDLSLSGQAKLLRVLEEKVVVRLGGSQPIHTDARVVAATNQDLAAMVREKRFREDLYFRLNVVTLELPPLRERGDDLVVLAEHFLDEFCRQARRATPSISPAARQRLIAHAWPGNVRELRNLMERLAYLTTGERIEADDVAFTRMPEAAAGALPEGGQSLTEATDQFQIEYIRRAIEGSSGNMADAARQLGLHRSNLYRKMRQLGMQPPR